MELNVALGRERYPSAQADCRDVCETLKSELTWQTAFAARVEVSRLLANTSTASIVSAADTPASAT